MQLDDWEEISAEISISDMSERLRNPIKFQVELSDLLSKLAADNGAKCAAEIGCETGITLMLMRNVGKRIFVDFDQGILEKVEQVCKNNNLTGNYFCLDMFNMYSIGSGEIDLVFNSGVIEHYKKTERKAAIKEYARVTKTGGYVVIAYPNHYSILYRIAYLTGKLLGHKIWPWPDEYKIRDLRWEMESSGLSYEKTILIDNKTSSVFYKRIPFINWLASDVCERFYSERYLRVCIGKKT